MRIIHPYEEDERALQLALKSTWLLYNGATVASETAEDENRGLI